MVKYFLIAFIYLLLAINSNYCLGQQYHFTDTGDSLVIDTVEILYGKEKRIETYLNGKLIKWQDYYENNQIKQEILFEGEKVVTSFGWYETGIVRYSSIYIGDTIKESVGFNDFGKVIEYESIRKGKLIKRTYDWHDNTLATEFTCDFNKNKRCVHTTYYDIDKPFMVFISKPLRFLKADSIHIAKINRNERIFHRYPVKDIYYDVDGSKLNETIFKKGVLFKTITYFKRGKVIRYYDSEGKEVIKEKIKGNVKPDETHPYGLLNQNNIEFSSHIIYGNGIFS